MDWIDLAWYRDKWQDLVNTIKKLRDTHQHAAHFFTGEESVSFSRKTLTHVVSNQVSLCFIYIIYFTQ